MKSGCSVPARIRSQAEEAAKESRLCRLTCGKAPPFRTSGSTLNGLGWAASRKATGFPQVKRHSRNPARGRFVHNFEWPGLCWQDARAHVATASARVRRRAVPIHPRSAEKIKNTTNEATMLLKTKEG